MAIKLSGLNPQNAWWKGRDWEKNDNDLKNLEILLNRRKTGIKKGEIYLLRGIRRAGKTVYAKLLIKDLTEKIDGKKIIYISCDRYSLREIKNIVGEFVKRFNGEVVIFDEITYLGGWNILLKELAETTDLTIIATGSNPVKIKEREERLPGRKIEGNEYFLNPLCFREFINNLVDMKDKIKNPDARRLASKIKKFDSFPPLNPNIEDMVPYFDEIEPLFYSYILTGGFPDATLEYLKKGKIDENFYETMIRLFLGTLSKENKSEEIGRGIMEKILISGSSRLDFITIASDIGIHHNTVREYMEVLEKSRIIYLLPAWDINKKRYSLRKQKKIIFQSSLIPQALHHYITGCTYEDILDFVDKNLEVIVEQLVSSHIIWSFEKPIIKERHSFAGFYYDRKECDLLILEHGKNYGYEIKYGKLEKERYPFKVFYITKDAMDENAYPAPLFLAGIEKSENAI
ncbi:MAG: AAA family ATPase [Candidatus Thermoplasmatota archaeon]|nr:AAA family ATPase [Candidatus Thermoplasmatota archaeon]